MKNKLPQLGSLYKFKAMDEYGDMTEEFVRHDDGTEILFMATEKETMDQWGEGYYNYEFYSVSGDIEPDACLSGTTSPRYLQVSLVCEEDMGKLIHFVQ